MTLGEKIKNYRSMRGLTQKELGDLTGIHEVSIRKYEANRIKPRREQLRRIAMALRVSLNEFLEIRVNRTSDMLPLLFAIDEKYEIKITSDDNQTFKIEFEDPAINYFLRDWQSAKEMYALGLISHEDYDLWKNMRSSYRKADLFKK